MKEIFINWQYELDFNDAFFEAFYELDTKYWFSRVGFIDSDTTFAYCAL